MYHAQVKIKKLWKFSRHRSEDLYDKSFVEGLVTLNILQTHHEPQRNTTIVIPLKHANIPQLGQMPQISFIRFKWLSSSLQCTWPKYRGPCYLTPLFLSTCNLRPSNPTSFALNPYN